MGCLGTRGFLYVAMILLERNFQLKRVKALNDLTFIRNLNKTRVCLIFTVFILPNCNTNCSTTVQYCKNMAFVQKHISLIHLETNSLLNYWFIDIDSLFYSHNTLIEKGPWNIKRTPFSLLVLSNVNYYNPVLQTGSSCLSFFYCQVENLLFVSLHWPFTCHNQPGQQ